MSLFFAKLLDIPNFVEYYQGSYFFDKVKSGEAEDRDFDEYLLEDIYDIAIIKVDGVYYAITDEDTLKYSTVSMKSVYSPLESGVIFNEYQEYTKKINKIESDIQEKLNTAERMIEAAEEIADKAGLSISWHRRYGVYKDGEWNSSSLSC